MKKIIFFLIVILFSVKLIAQEKKLTVIFDIGKVRESLNYNDGNNDCTFLITDYNLSPFIAKKYNLNLQFKYPILEKIFIRFGASSIYSRSFSFQYKSGYSPNDIPLDNNENIANRNYTFSYIDIPLIFDYEIFVFHKLHIYNAIGIISNIKLFKNDEISYIRNYNFATSSFSIYQKKSNTSNENFCSYIQIILSGHDILNIMFLPGAYRKGERKRKNKVTA